MPAANPGNPLIARLDKLPKIRPDPSKPDELPDFTQLSFTTDPQFLQAAQATPVESFHAWAATWDPAAKKIFAQTKNSHTIVAIAQEFPDATPQQWEMVRTLLSHVRNQCTDPVSGEKPLALDNKDPKNPQVRSRSLVRLVKKQLEELEEAEKAQAASPTQAPTPTTVSPLPKPTVSPPPELVSPSQPAAPSHEPAPLPAPQPPPTATERPEPLPPAEGTPVFSLNDHLRTYIPHPLTRKQVIQGIRKALAKDTEPQAVEKFLELLQTSYTARGEKIDFSGNRLQLAHQIVQAYKENTLAPEPPPPPIVTAPPHRTFKKEILTNILSQVTRDRRFSSTTDGLAAYKISDTQLTHLIEMLIRDSDFNQGLAAISNAPYQDLQANWPNAQKKRYADYFKSKESGKSPLYLDDRFMEIELAYPDLNLIDRQKLDEFITATIKQFESSAIPPIVFRMNASFAQRDLSQQTQSHARAVLHHICNYLEWIHNETIATPSAATLPPAPLATSAPLAAEPATKEKSPAEQIAADIAAGKKVWVIADQLIRFGSGFGTPASRDFTARIENKGYSDPGASHREKFTQLFCQPVEHTLEKEIRTPENVGRQARFLARIELLFFNAIDGPVKDKLRTYLAQQSGFQESQIHAALAEYNKAVTASVSTPMSLKGLVLSDRKPPVPVDKVLTALLEAFAQAPRRSFGIAQYLTAQSKGQYSESMLPFLASLNELATNSKTREKIKFNEIF